MHVVTALPAAGDELVVGQLAELEIDVLATRGAGARNQVGEKGRDVASFQEVNQPMTMLLTSPGLPPVKLDSGSTTTTDGFNSSTSRCIVAR